MKRYVLITDEGGWLDIRYMEERASLKHPLLLGQVQVYNGRIQYINVKPSRRRRGYGTMLVQIAEKCCDMALPPKDIMPTPEAVGFWKAQERRS